MVWRLLVMMPLPGQALVAAVRGDDAGHCRSAVRWRQVAQRDEQQADKRDHEAAVRSVDPGRLKPGVLPRLGWLVEPPSAAIGGISPSV